jgi:hypothetical protein
LGGKNVNWKIGKCERKAIDDAKSEKEGKLTK